MAPTTTISPAKPSTRGRRLARRFLVLGVALAVLAAPVAWVQHRGPVRTVATVEAAPVAIVLGAGLWSGKPSPYLTRRLRAAVELYDRGKVEVILVTGDRSGPHYDEPAAMRDWLLDHGVPDERIVRDTAGYDTYDSCVRAHEAFGVTDAIVISQDYHVPRALFLCQRAGINAQGVGVSATTAEWWQSTYFAAREIPSSYKAAWDSVAHRTPVGGIEHSSAITEALDRAELTADRPD